MTQSRRGPSKLVIESRIAPRSLSVHQAPNQAGSFVADASAATPPQRRRALPGSRTWPKCPQSSRSRCVHFWWFLVARSNHTTAVGGWLRCCAAAAAHLHRFLAPTPNSAPTSLLDGHVSLSPSTASLMSPGSPKRPGSSPKDIDVAKAKAQQPEGNGDRTQETHVSRVVAGSLLDFTLILSLLFGGCCSCVFL